MGFWGFMIIPPGENFQNDWGTEVKTTLESSEFGNFGRFQVRDRFGLSILLS
jgi:hypothetical protein